MIKIRVTYVRENIRIDDSSLVENYRLISILSSIPKILEKVMYDQL